jgi:hypothetical protein|tara:strand:+ start:2122 stop:2340 length:219 start_codon:yes stop_codon:yes gene_type:complete
MTEHKISIENALGFGKKAEDITLDDLLNRLSEIETLDETGQLHKPYAPMSRKTKIVQLMVLIENLSHDAPNG